MKLDGLVDTTRVALSTGHDGYGSAPFSPQYAWPEYPFAASPLSPRANAAYEGVRSALALLGLDAADYGSKEWNPLGVVVRPGDTVVLKPNFVRNFRETAPEHADCLTTHGAVIRSVLDYVFLALMGEGRVIIADAPQNDADFEAIRRMAGLDEIQDFYKRQAGFKVEVYDLRPERAEKKNGVIVGHAPLPGDPAGYVRVNLGAHSAFSEINELCHLLYGSEYDTAELRHHQHGDIHEYLIAKTVLDADVVISLPKLKTHKKVGLTVNMKNLVGINGNKNWLPHHREGTPAQGGDQFPENSLKCRVERVMVAQFKRLFPRLGPLRRLIAGPAKSVGAWAFGDTNAGTVRSGNWYGNDTTWRMVIDLNRILRYADADGNLHDQPVRRSFGVVDGIVGGEGNGPLDPSPRHVGVILAGVNPVTVDLVCARLLGFDYERIAVLRNALKPHPYPITTVSYPEIRVCSNNEIYDRGLEAIEDPGLAFVPHFGWKGHIEIPKYLRGSSGAVPTC